MKELERKRSPEIEKYRLGDSGKAVLLLRKDDENAILVIPEGVRVRRVLTEEEIEAMKKSGQKMPLLKTMNEGVHRIVPGEFIAIDVKTKRGTTIKFNPNSHHSQKKAA